jgi:hypothetical protein
VTLQKASLNGPKSGCDTSRSASVNANPERRRSAGRIRKRKSYFRLTTGSIAPGLTISSTLLATADGVVE